MCSPDPHHEPLCRLITYWVTRFSIIKAWRLSNAKLVGYLNTVSRAGGKDTEVGKKEEKKSLWIKTISQFLIVCVGSDWSSHHSPADGGKWIAKGNSIENDAAPQVWCNSTAVMHTSLYHHSTHCLHQPKTNSSKDHELHTITVRAHEHTREP